MANSYLTRTPSSTGNNQKFTISCWLKRSGLGSQQIFANAYNAQSDNGFLSARLSSTDQFEITGWQTTWRVSSQKFRDTSAWYHFVIAIDTTLATAGDRIKIYVNGSQITDFSTSNNPSQNHNFPFNTASFVQDVGTNNYGSGRTQFWNGYISHYAQVDGSQLTPTSFGLTDSTSGIWKFKPPSGVTWGTNGVHLKFENSGAMGTDSSGNSNTYTVGGNLKQSLSTPSNVYATFNPLDVTKGTATTFSNGNTTTMHNDGGNGAVTASRSTLGYSSGKWYWEAKCISTGGDIRTGIISMSSTDYSNNTNPYSNNECYNYKQNGKKGSSGQTDTNYANTYTAGDIIGIAHDADSGSLTFYKNSVSQGVAFSGLSTSLTWGAFTSEYNQGKYDYNFGNGFFGTTAITSAGSNGNGSLFEYDVPSGYYALNTKNINTYG